jgi:glutaminyl-tRNA synthetase
VRLVIEDYPGDRVEEITLVNNPEDPSAGSRVVPFSRVLFMDRDDFREDPPKGYFRLSPGSEVRLRGAPIVRCTGIVKDSAGEIVEIRCTHDPESRTSGRRVKGTIHWVSAAHAVEGEVRLYDSLFSASDPEGDESGGDFRSCLNPASLEVLTGCKLEPGLAGAAPGAVLQFERVGYFCVDAKDSSPGRPVFNRTVGLRDTWAKIERTRAGSAS